MEQYFTLVLTGLTSVGAYLVGARFLGLSGHGLQAAVGRMLEYVGVTLAFLIVNLALAATAILVLRIFTREFVSLYLAKDVTLLVLSLLQGLTFQLWRERPPPRLPERPQRGTHAGGPTAQGQ